MGKYVWDYSNFKVPEISPHSITKHEVIERYVKIYLEIVGGYYYSESLIINLVDGFSGGGLYLNSDGEPHLGSPMIFIKRVKEAEAKLDAEKPHGFKMRPKYYFVEKNPKTKNFLQKFLEDEVGGAYMNNIQIFCDPFSNVYEKIIDDIKKRGTAHRSIFLLDQYGYSKVPIPLINYIFKKLPNAEIILTFNVDSMIDYLSDTNESRAMLNKIGIDFELNKIKYTKAAQRQWRTWIQFALYNDFVGKISSNMYPIYLLSQAIVVDLIGYCIFP